MPAALGVGGGERVHEAVVGAPGGAARIVTDLHRMDDLKVIDVHADGQNLAVGVRAREHARM